MPDTSNINVNYTVDITIIGQGAYSVKLQGAMCPGIRQMPSNADSIPYTPGCEVRSEKRRG